MLEHLEWAPGYVVIDACTASMDVEGLDPIQNREVATWLRPLAKPLAKAGAAVLIVDHVTKSKEGRDRWAIGGQHKLAAVDGAAYTLESVRPIGRALGAAPVNGLSRLVLVKDRRGYIRGRVPGEKLAPVADVAMVAYPDGGLSVHLEAPGRAEMDDNQARIVGHLAVYDGATKSALRVLGNSDSIDTATKDLIAAGHVNVERAGASHRHHLTDNGRATWAEIIAASTGADQ